MKNEVINELYMKSGSKTVKALKERGFDAYYAADREKAVNLALKLIPADHSVGWGGAMTVDELGLKQKLSERGNRLIDRDSAKTPEERVKIMKQALVADTFLMSSNAVTQDGQLLNIDGAGNRVAALCYGPDQVIVIAGMNKVVPDIEAAYKRARGYAAPANAQRFDIDTPCRVNGACADCKSKDSICAQIVHTRACTRPAGRIKVILVGEDLGL